jgi:hypothetical protein
LAKEIKSLNEKFEEFRKGEELARNMQFAQTMLIDIRANRDRQFGHYDSVRRGTLGMLQAMDAGIVTQSALQQAAERLMIDTPGYWLAPAQVALAAWINNNEGLANRALMEAMARDPNKTALFFCLVLARQERYDATARWMHEYVNRQDPMALSREFTVVLDAAVQGALGERALQLVKQRFITWYEQLRSAEKIVNEQTARWQRRIIRNQRDIAGQFKVLAHHSPDWEKIAQWLNGSTVHEETLRWLRSQLETTEVMQDGLRQRVDGVLRNLVTQYDQIEDSLRREELMWTRVIEHKGNRELAERIHVEETPSHEDQNGISTDESVSDFMSLLTTIGVTPEQVGASRSTVQLAIRFCGTWITAAAENVSKASRNENAHSIAIKVGSWTGRLGDAGDNAIVMAEFDKHVEKEMRRGLTRVNARGPIRASVASLILFMLALAGARVFGPSISYLASALGISAIVMITCGIWLLRVWRTLPEKKDEVRRISQEMREEGHSALQKSVSEARQIFQKWDDNLAKEDSLVEYIDDQSTRANLIAVPMAADDDRPKISGPLPREDTREDALRQLSDSQSFAFRLPDWDLLPPLWMGDYNRSTGFDR